MVAKSESLCDDEETIFFTSEIELRSPGQIELSRDAN
jgi:hypothetical protein